jgi:hypothetical protein
MPRERRPIYKIVDDGVRPNEERRLTMPAQREIGDRPREEDYDAAHAWHTLRRAWEIRQDSEMMSRVRMYEERQKDKRERYERLEEEYI